MNKMIRFSKWFRGIEPQWYLCWAVGCVAIGIATSTSTSIIIGVMYLFLANVAKQRNDAERRVDATAALLGSYAKLVDSYLKLDKP